MGIGSIIGAGASLLGGIFGSDAASDAADAQRQAAAQAAAQAQAQYQQTRSDLQPYRDTGAAASNALSAALPDLTKTWNPTQAALEATPGYQFTLNQGLKSTQNSAAARGLGLSGAALKGASTYATGLADSTWQNVFNADQTQKNNQYNKLYNTSALGENAAAQTGSAGLTATGMSNNALMSGANATGAADIASANALTSGLTGAANSMQNYLLYNKLMGGGSTSGLFGGSMAGF